MNIFKTTVGLILFAFPWTLDAKVNLYTGQFHHQETDFQKEFQGTPLKLWRAYNSQSQYIGLYGRGWCSNMEYRLQKKKSGGYDLLWCHKILHSFQPSAKSNRFRSNDGTRLTFRNKRWTFTSLSGEQRVFGPKGQFMGWTTGLQKKMIQLKSNKTSTVIFFGGRSLKILKRSGHITGFLWKKKNIAQFQVQKNQLLFAQSNNNKPITYSYKNKRLSGITKSNGQGLKIFFKKRLVQKLEDWNKCTETYRYFKESRLKVQVSVSRKCGPTPIVRNYRFAYYPSGKLKTFYDTNKKRRITFTPDDQKVLVDSTPRQEKRYVYGSRRRPQKFSIESARATYQTQFIYGNEAKIEKMIYTLPNKKKVNVRLKYSRNGQLTKIQNSYGESFKLSYKGPYLKTVRHGQNALSYLYDKNDHVRMVSLKKGSKTIKQDLKKNGSTKNLKIVGGFLNEMYTSLGPAYNDSFALKGLL